MCSSFHDVWMELHEDLIVLQRIDRVEEGSFCSRSVGVAVERVGAGTL